ncbi:DNA polymerase sigma subunit [Klebsormidium nitens]|uniref:polynucleotide adenylyltransferase n=1 Tax=Klebsormidium nitens TaxID=105231 RepID=A0A1Y1IEF2_KLENI|nr:DNA polymerase sigma subunit [Klebsormidium nitens]|eukprot:GAQ89300.1 DNA polymerase sigma subunit [Klebsormidium nitens]
MDSDEEDVPTFKYDIAAEPLGSWDAKELHEETVTERGTFLGQVAARVRARQAATSTSSPGKLEETLPDVEPSAVNDGLQAARASEGEIGEFLSLEDFEEPADEFRYALADEDDEDHEEGSSGQQAGKAGYTPPPWALASVKRGLVRSPLLRLHQEIIDFCDFLAATDDERALREAAVERVKDVILSIWPDCTPTVFGSYATGLFLPTSDMDMVVLNSGVDNVPNALRALSLQLSKRRIAKQIQVIAKARVPIIKFVEVESKIQFDISFDVENGPAAAKFIRQSMKTLPPLRPLCLVVKIFLQQRELNEVYTGGIGSYALIVMLMAHLQLHPSRRGYESGGPAQPLDSNLGILLIDFFELYGKMLNVRDVGVSCKDGGAFFNKREAGTFNHDRPFLLSVRDPQDENNDIGKNSYNVQKVRSAFMHAHNLLTTEGEAGQGLLERIVRMDKILLKRKVAPPSPGHTPEAGVSTPHGAYEADLDTTEAKPSRGSKRERSDEGDRWAPKTSPNGKLDLGGGRKKQRVEAEEEPEAEDPDGEESPEEGQIEVEPRKKKKKMRPAKVKRMQARQAAKQAEIDLVNSVASERGLASPPGKSRQEDGSQRKVLNTGKGLVVVASR